MIISVPSSITMTSEHDTLLVLIDEVTTKSGSNGPYKKVRALHETGNWFTTFYFHIFERYSVYETIKPGTKLKVKVQPLEI